MQTIERLNSIWNSLNNLEQYFCMGLKTPDEYAIERQSFYSQVQDILSTCPESEIEVYRDRFANFFFD